MKNFASILSDPQLLKKEYFQTDWAQSVINAIQDYSKMCLSPCTRGSSLAMKRKKGIFERMSSRSTEEDQEQKEYYSINSVSSIELDLDDEEEEEEDELNTIEHLEIQKSLMNRDKLRVKIIVTEITDSAGTKAIRQILSPLLSKTKFLPDMGMFHSAIMVGPWKLEWNDSGLCIPKQLVSTNALIACDLTEDMTLTGSNIDEIAGNLVDIIIKWNTTVEYESVGGDGVKSGNCQQFVDAVLETIGINKSNIYKGAMGSYFERLKKKGKGNMKFVLEEEFKKRFNIPTTQKSVKFKTHCELDQFVLQLLDIDPLADKNYPNEFKLLKSFDRAFWLRHLSGKKSMADPRWQPYREEEPSFDGVALVLKCHFGDPRERFSFVYESK
ncbi:predicted protein [Naegleria gruberi]|uniref:Predicted protein n=1 Tax=Naegleria gruberi TaxID=5762 RepID=D2VZU9_NAEGR|nr:uncharacterized protein NAEGRDRAFT_53592 [Naegleria gruberi]EFC37592.1 predicted protein [Naegleria gruberi]|eukprot:XP_002670336.1 predicted protein [Naegleria gruberi strain NEG-M]